MLVIADSLAEGWPHPPVCSQQSWPSYDMQTTEGTLQACLVLVTRVKLHYWTPQDICYIKSLLSRSGDTADTHTANTQTNKASQTK